MNPFATQTTWTTDDFAAELADTALHVAAQHGGTTASVEAELTLWHDLASTLKGDADFCRVLVQATDAAYRTLVRYGPSGPSLTLKRDLRNAFRNHWSTRSALEASVAC